MEMECSMEDMNLLQKELAESSTSNQATGGLVQEATPVATASSITHEEEDFDI